MEARGRRLSWWMGGIAAAGVLVTHWLTYRFALPDHHHRAEVLHATGHAHLPVASVLGLALFTVASFRVCALGARGAPLPDLRSLALRLAGLQAVAWTVLEIGERAASGRLATVDDHRLLLTGLAIQVAVALLGALFLRAAHGVAAALVRPMPVVHPRPQSVRLPIRPSHPHRLLPLTGGRALRGPPSLRLTS